MNDEWFQFFLTGIWFPSMLSLKMEFPPDLINQINFIIKKCAFAYEYARHDQNGIQVANNKN